MKVAFLYPNGQKKESQGPGYIASAIMEAGYDLDFYDQAYMPFTSHRLKWIARAYDVVMLSAMTLSFPTAVEVAKLIKFYRSKTTILLGGLHATVLPKEVLSHDCFDYICVGEGEEFVVEFLGKLDRGEDVNELKNLGYRSDGGKIIVNPCKPCPSLDSLPRYRRDVYREESVIHQKPYPGFCYVHASRGCPYRCSYCANQCYLDLYGKGYLRVRSIDSVIEELLQIKQLYPAVKFFYFGDEMLLHSLEYCQELFPRIKAEVSLPYGCMVRVEQVTTELVNLFTKTGCQYVGLGVECGNEEFRRGMLNRRMSNPQIIEAFQLLRLSKPHLDTMAFCMHGWPVPYDDQLTEETLALIQQIQPTRYQLNTFFPFPGTKIYDYCVDNDLIDWNKYHAKRELRGGESVLKPFVGASK